MGHGFDMRGLDYDKEGKVSYYLFRTGHNNEIQVEESVEKEKKII